jgi:uncharacterized repeat protein (TIGR03943 family)
MTVTADQAEHADHDDGHDHGAREDVQAWLKTAILLGLGLYFVYNIVSGNLTNYINIRFAWLSYVAAVLFLLIGGFSLLNLLRRRNHAHAHAHHDHDHGSGGMSWFALAVVATPLLLGTLIPSRPLGAEAIEGDISVNSASLGSVTTFAVNPQDRNVLDWLRVFNSTTDYSELNGQPADVIGFVYLEPNFGADQFMVARFTISCCVADASAIAMPVAWDQAADLPQGEWVRVQGAIQTGEFRGERMPIVQAASVELIAQPEHPYLYP